MSIWRTRFFDVRARSLVRANVLVAVSMVLGVLLSGFPEIRPSGWLAVPALLCVAGTVETARCMRKTWTFYHAGVVLCIYMDLMVLVAILFFLFYPGHPG